MKLLIITGPTATGKTSLALQIAKHIPADIISCDSRQIYEHMDIITGKDIPLGFTKQPTSLKTSHITNIPTYSSNSTSIYGYDLITPDQEFSAAHYVEFFHKTYKHITSQDRLAILVGGTGYYIKTLLCPPETLFIKPNPQLRTELKNKAPSELYTMLSQKDPSKAKSLNSSDQSNPHRLIRAIEIARSPKVTPPDWFLEFKKDLPKIDSLVIGLTAPNQVLYKRIDIRVHQRIAAAIDQEIEYLKQHKYIQKAPSQTIGYKQWIKYLYDQISKQQAIQEWQFAEHAYARRQLTILKTLSTIEWFDITSAGYQTHIVNSTTQWYSKN